MRDPDLRPSAVPHVVWYVSPERVVVMRGWSRTPSAFDFACGWSAWTVHVSLYLALRVECGFRIKCCLSQQEFTTVVSALPCVPGQRFHSLCCSFLLCVRRRVAIRHTCGAAHVELWCISPAVLSCIGFVTFALRAFIRYFQCSELNRSTWCAECFWCVLNQNQEPR